MKKHLSKNLIMMTLFIGTVAFLSYIVQNLGKPAQIPPAKTIVKKEANEAKPRGLIKEALLPKQNELEYCYENYLKTKPEVTEGSVTVRWLVDANGVVLSTHLDESDLEDQVLTGCLIEKLKGLSFSPPPGHRETMLAYKFRFRTEAKTALNFSDETH